MHQWTSEDGKVTIHFDTDDEDIEMMISTRVHLPEPDAYMKVRLSFQVLEDFVQYYWMAVMRDEH